MKFSSADRPYTAWYRIWERVSLSDFYQELVILPLLIVVVLVNVWGSRANRFRAKQWAAAHLPLLESEFSRIGFGKGGGRTSPKVEDKEGAVEVVKEVVMGTTDVPDDMLEERSKAEYICYATGRQNVAALDIKISLYPRYNPLKWAFDVIASFFFDSMPAPVERMEATAYCFDGKEKSLVLSQQPGPPSKDSGFDGFVFAIVHKDKMRQLRDDRYDISLTSTKDHPKLPEWATVMSESAEVTETMLTPELIKAVTDAGEDLEALIVSDMPIDAPRKYVHDIHTRTQETLLTIARRLNDLVPQKRISLSMRLSHLPPSSNSLFALFLRLPDHLVNTAHFRPEALRKVKQTREDATKKIKRADEDEKAEDRKVAGDKMKKDERDKRLSSMSAVEQKKFLQKEQEKEQRKGNKKRTTKG